MPGTVLLRQREWPAVAVTSPRTGVAPGHQVGRQAVAAAVAEVAVHDSSASCSAKLCRSFREEIGGDAVGLFGLWKEIRSRRRDGRKAIIISQCAFSLGRPRRDGRSEQKKTRLGRNHGRKALKSSLKNILRKTNQL